jgi:soluble lytic murein transglycosylase-like protein
LTQGLPALGIRAVAGTRVTYRSGIKEGLSRGCKFARPDNEQEIMTRLTVLAAAFAAGLTTFAANADDIVLASAKAYAENPAAAEVEAGARNTPRAKTGKTAEEVYHASKVAAKALKDEPASAAKPVAWEPREPYSAIIERYAVLHGVSVSLAHAVIRVESNYRPYALGKAGEVGLMQIKPATARMMGYSGSTTGLFDPETNIRYGMKYLAKAQQLGDGSTCGTILKYNAGHAARRMNRVSLDYCGKVKRHLAGV